MTVQTAEPAVFWRNKLADMFLKASGKMETYTTLSLPQDYMPCGGVREFWNANDQEVIIAGPADTGKTLGALWKIHQICTLYPGTQAVIVRKVQEDMAGSVLQTWTDKVVSHDPSVTSYGGHKPYFWVYPNGSKVWTCGLDKPGKVLSSERDIIYVNQAEELVQPDWEILLSRCSGRAGNVPYPQLMGDCNPESPTHWIKSRSNPKLSSYPLRLIVSQHTDNPELYDQKTLLITEAGKQRLGALDRMTGARRLRLRLGIWAQPEAAIYDVFDEVHHKVAAFPIPPTWPRVVGIDPYGAYIGALWLAFDPQNNILNVYREYFEPFGLTTPGHVAKIRELSKGETIWVWAGGGPSENQARVDWSSFGIPLQEAPITEVWAGIDRVYQLMRDFSIVIHDNCINLLSEVGSYRRKVINGITTEQIENKDTYHLLDALRYIVAYLTGPKEERTEVIYDPIRIGNG